ncbi:gp071 [Rhodococcus phage ReqiPepy6]|uniref:Gp071 n=1 Tax=Rhodococcus phage ReqiPepy6 TaxID=691965 RepID=D4P7I2_9CAUD|nr:gp071 [Rhodococcus phage ReqiPepy6]ADD80962.1 gp071 [Rhodococcus phage ReqiPepy6]
MDEPLDERYFKWLYGQVASVKLRNPGRTYWSLLKVLHTTEFVWLVPNDDNRVEDGRDLRLEFVNETRAEVPDPDWMAFGCSVLEMLIGLSRRLAFEADGNAGASEWFWHLLDNINLGGFNDTYFRTGRHEEYVKHVLDTVVWRNYKRDGQGGLFPLRRPQEDQRKVELWYQLSCYLSEGHAA